MDKTILIVEDEKDIRDAMAEAATQEGFNVLVADNGETGLNTALTQKPDLILLDIKMPVMTGLEALQKLRRDPWGQHAKVIMLTSMDDVENIGTAHQSGITSYVIKAHHSLEDIMSKIKLSIYSD